MQYRLAAILAADVISYSRLMGKEKAATLGSLTSHREQQNDPMIAEHTGRIVKLMGDGVNVTARLEGLTESQRTCRVC